MSAADPAPVPDLEPEDDALLLFTSGSSGSPKGVLLTHGNLLANAHGVSRRTGITPDDRLLHAMPLYHTNGINNQLIVPFLCGASVVLIDRFRAETFFDELARHRPTYITGVPTIYSRLLAHAVPRDALKGLRFARCGSAPITEALHRRIEEHLGIPLVISYGLSEATCTSTMNPPAARRIGTVGTPLDAQDVTLLAPNSEIEVPRRSEGEICIRGLVVMKRYLGAVGSEERVVSNGWLRTGDLGRFDEDGYLSVTGRLKEVIIRGGENLSPRQIEAALLAHSGVKACCVVGAPDPDLGEIPVAFVVAEDGYRVKEDELQALARDRLSRIYVPRRIYVLDALPENSIGKVDRKVLKQLAAQGPL